MSNLELCQKPLCLQYSFIRVFFEKLFSFILNDYVEKERKNRIYYC